MIVIFLFALVGSHSLTFNPDFIDPNFPQTVDPYMTQYNDLSKMFWIVYTAATYDFYPDNQILAAQNYYANWLFWHIFVTLNMFLFSVIHTSLIYQKFR